MSYTHPSWVDTPLPKTAPGLRWGIIGCGNIANTFARSIAHTVSTVHAVAARSSERAAEFALMHQAATHYGGPEAYRALVADESVDAIYVATPHSLHKDHALLAINAGKPVLVEKAFTCSWADAQEVLSAGQKQQVLVMEAMWTRFLPHMVLVRELVQSGAIGEVMSVHADFGGKPEFDPASRNFDPRLGGGALLDLGVYPLNFVHDILGSPEQIYAVGELAPTGVDWAETVLLNFPARSAKAVAESSFRYNSPRTARVAGTAGYIQIHSDYYRPTSVTLITPVGHTEYRAEIPLGWQYQVAAFARSLAAGETENSIMPHRATLEVMAVMDEVRHQLGVELPDAAAT